MKRTALFALLAVSLTASSALTACSSASTDEETAADEDAIGTTNLSASHFGLTDQRSWCSPVDDGADPRTIALAGRYAADWACQGKVSVSQCTDGYVDESLDKKNGIIVAYDVHSHGNDMLVGTGQALGRSLIKGLRSHGLEGTTDGYRYQGELTVSRDPELAGAREWNLQFDLG